MSSVVIQHEELELPATPDFITYANEQVLASYEAQPSLIEEQANQEIAAAEGAYGRRQLYELVQNGVDALLGASGGPGIVHVLLTEDALYCANSGQPITKGGVRAILQSFLSRKTGSEIGRYGLGFKSVLGVTDTPEFYSSLVSFKFDPDWSAALIREKTRYEGLIPKLRLARLADIGEARAGNEILDSLLEWATSVVRLPFRDSRHAWLNEDIRNFPGEFLLFCPQLSELVLEDRSVHGEPEIRKVSREGEDPIRIVVNDKVTEWRVFTESVRPSEDARIDGGHFAGREEVQLSWALPARGGLSDGQFWAYFPIEKERMSLKGILNAAWKLNDDRQNILDGKFNDELLIHAARLTLKNLDQLLDRSDPGKILEVFPARLDERVGADLRLTKFFYEESQHTATVPDTYGKLRKASELYLHPKYLNQAEGAIHAWGTCPYQPQNWAHISTVANTTRSARIDQLLTAGQARQTYKRWLEALVSSDNIKRASQLGGVSEDEAKAICSAHALQAAAALYDVVIPAVRYEILEAEILLIHDGILVPPKKDTVFLPAMHGLNYPGVDIVHPLLMERSELESSFQKLGITKVDASSELQALLATRGSDALSQKDWERVWNLITQIEENPETAGRPAAILKEYCGDEDPKAVIHVRTCAASFEPIRNTLLPGEVVLADGGRDASVAIDTNFHSGHESLLRELGASEAPSSGGGSEKEGWFKQYRAAAINQFYTQLASRNIKTQPYESRLIFKGRSFPGPLEPLPQLSDGGRARFTAHLLLLTQGEKDWKLVHSTKPEIYPSLSLENPALWMIRRHGILSTSKGLTRIEQAVSPKMDRWSEYLPVANIDHQSAQLLGLPESPDQVTPKQWQQALEEAARVEDVRKVGEFYASFCAVQPPPELLFCRMGSRFVYSPPTEVTVAVHNETVESALKSLDTPYVIVDEASAAANLQANWYLKSSDAVVSIEPKFVPSGPTVPVGDAFVGLSIRLTSDQNELSLVPCTSVRREIITAAGSQSEDREFLRDGNRLYYLDRYTPGEVLDKIAQELGVPLTDYEREDILSLRDSEEERQLLGDIRRIPELSEKLLACVGAESLRRRLSEQVIDAAVEKHGELTDRIIAETYLAVFGVESLTLLKEDLQRSGLPAPKQWAGTYNARKFVKELGFPPEFAGFQSTDRQPAIDIEGQPHLPELHKFQKEAVTRIKGLLFFSGKRRRGLLSLPTGSGKTRVAVEAICRAIRDDEFEGPVLWVAQSDELCEQAVQSWSEVWRGIGSEKPLRINRLWSYNEADEWPDGPQVVVATMQKLQYVATNSDYDWLKECSVIVIDEAHLSVTPGYTAILEWVGATRKADRCPVLGLTATPFRGGEAETGRLVARYANNRLDEGLFAGEPYATLQGMGVLAEVRHRLLDGMNVILSEDELRELRKVRQLPASAEKRIGADRLRNATLLDSIKSLPSDWPVLLFAVSVEHARTISALLNAENITSAAVSAETAPGARRFYVEKFRQGKIRVLTNYGVLTTGFDAPAVRAIYVARPVFSPVMYQQMIGRGLRGPRNRGKEECLIVNVKDNFEQFGEELAFTEFEYLWSE